MEEKRISSRKVRVAKVELLGVIQLVRRVLHAQHKQVLLQGVELGVQLSNAHGTNFTCLHLIHLLPGSRPRA